MSFSISQTFYVDPASVASSTTASISKIDLYFKSKPQATNNKSGITNPGVQIYLTPTANSVPVLDNFSTMRWSRREYSDINISTNATIKTTFVFDPPVPVATDKQMAMILQYDGNEDYVPWLDIKGEYLVGTTTVSPGASGSYLGNYYTFQSAVPIVPNVIASNTNMVTIGQSNNLITPVANASYASATWRASTGVSLKFSVYVARYSFSGNVALAAFTNNTSPTSAQISNSVPILINTTGETEFILPQDRYEYLAYDRVGSSISNISPGERIFPVLPYYPPGNATLTTLSCNVGSNTIVAVGGGINWSTLLSVSANQPENLIIVSRNHNGANADLVNIRMVTEIVSNTVIKIDIPLSFTNTVANFYRAPVAVVDQFKRARFFGSDQDIVICKASTANTAQRFVPYSVANIAIVNGGTGYSNTDWVKVMGHNSLTNKILGSYNANATITTNANGTITAINLANVGSGFSNVANVTYIVANTTGTASVGTTANLTISIGTNLKTEFLGVSGRGGNFINSHPIDIEVGQVMPGLLVSVPTGTHYTSSIRFPYYSLDDGATPTGRQTYCDVDNAWDILNIQTFTIHQPFEFAKRRVLPSWSNELFTPYANGTTSQGFGGTSNTPQQALTSNASVIKITTISNNDFSHITVVPVASKITYSRYIINNDYTNENTNYGNAWARGIETKFNLANNALAEDILVYATVYKPANTDVLCFARLYNTHDNDAFDSKDWTMLQLRAGNNIVSSPTNLQDTYELTWGLQQYPNVAFQLSGSITTVNGNTTLTGANTTFSSNLVAGDLVLIQNGLFPNLYMIAVANVITNATSMTISKPIANLNLVGSGFKLSKIAYKYQAFNNYLNDNVARYYSSTLSENDGFNAAQIKLVMLSANGLSVPLIADVRAVAVSS